MAGTVHVAMRLLLLCLIPPGVYEVDAQVFPSRRYIRYSCEEKACVRVWQVNSGRNYIAMVSNETIQTHTSEQDASECPLKIKALTVADIEHQHCVQTPSSTAPALNVMPGKTLSLRCFFLTYWHSGCIMWQQRQVTLKWVDEAGAEIQGSQYKIKFQTICDTTLTVTFQRPENKKFRCQMSVDGKVRISPELRVIVPALKGKGRGFMKEVDTKLQGSNGSVVGAVVGVVVCVALTAMVALFVVNRKRTNRQLPNESSYTPSDNDDMNRDDVIYADIIFPVSSNRACVHEWDSTEYACIQHK